MVTLQQQIKEDFSQNSSRYLYEKYLLGNCIWYFKDYLEKKDYSEIYDEFKLYIANKFVLPFNNIAIFGSAKTGVSFAPKKNFRLFKRTSDIDLVLVSREYFSLFWDAYHEKLNNTRLSGYEDIASAILRKFIIFDGFDAYSDKIYSEWLTKTGDFQKDLFVKFDIEHKLNYRIFESWQAVEAYYINSITKLKYKLQ